MTKEQEEAIENLTKLLKQRNEKQVKITTYNLFENIETVLNMLKEKDEEIENLKQALASMKETAKAKEDLEMLNKGWQTELENKDKIIYEMIGSFIDLGFGFEYCNNDDRCINDCDKCIEQYFKEIAERKSEE